MAWLIKCSIILTSILFVSLSEAGPRASEVKVQFQKKKIQLSKTTLNVEVAETYEQHSHGLMYREKLGENEGMIFVFADTAFRSFWMKNTYLDLSIGYFDESRRLFQILDMKASSLMQKEFANYNSSSPAKYALEVPKGWFEKNKVKIGDKFDWR